MSLVRIGLLVQNSEVRIPATKEFIYPVSLKSLTFLC